MQQTFKHFWKCYQIAICRWIQKANKPFFWISSKSFLHYKSLTNFYSEIKVYFILLQIGRVAVLHSYFLY